MPCRVVESVIDSVFTRPRSSSKLVDIRLFDSAVHSIHDTFLFSRYPRLTSSLIDMGRNWGGIINYYPPEIVSMCIPPIPHDIVEQSTGTRAAFRAVHEIAANVYRTEAQSDVHEYISFDLSQGQLLVGLLLAEDENLVDIVKEE